MWEFKRICRERASFTSMSLLLRNSRVQHHERKTNVRIEFHLSYLIAFYKSRDAPPEQRHMSRHLGFVWLSPFSGQRDKNFCSFLFRGRMNQRVEKMVTDNKVRRILRSRWFVITRVTRKNSNPNAIISGNIEYRSNLVAMTMKSSLTERGSF